MSADPYTAMVATLLGEPLPALPAIPGRRITARDEPIAPEFLVGITSSTELGLVLGISRQLAHQRMQKAARHD